MYVYYITWRGRSTLWSLYNETHNLMKIAKIGEIWQISILTRCHDNGSLDEKSIFSFYTFTYAKNKQNPCFEPATTSLIFTANGS